VVIHQTDPTQLVTATFRRIREERMTDVPLPPLAVEAVGFRPWQGHWLGVLVTPWAMSLLLLPGTTENWQLPAEGKKKVISFPSGDYAFLGGVEEGMGEYQSCSLISPMGHFPDQETACLAAEAVLVALLQTPVKPAATAPKSTSRRGFLTGRIDKAAGDA
jgi:[NiFe] hydrogenase assembly HybE family chaperone